MADLKAIASQIRRDILRMVHGASSGHPGGSLGCADFFAALYFEIMKHNPKFSMDGKNEDIFFLSNGHISQQRDNVPLDTAPVGYEGAFRFWPLPLA